MIFCSDETKIGLRGLNSHGQDWRNDNEELHPEDHPNCEA